MLKKIGEIEIQQTSIHVAKNGEYQLVCLDGEDAYGTPMYKRLSLVEAEREGTLQDLCKELIQAIGKLLTEKQGVADSRRATLQGTKLEE